MLKKLDWMLIALIAAVVMIGIVLVTSIGPAAAKGKCASPALLKGSFASHGATLTPLPAGPYTKARGILDTVHKGAAATDAAILIEMPDDSGGIAFISKGCLIALMPLPSKMSIAKMKAYLFSEPAKAPSERAYYDAYKRLEI